jgi:hypothetical protein
LKLEKSLQLLIAANNEKTLLLRKNTVSKKAGLKG